METKPEIPSNFRTLINDFANDLSVTFPEHEHLWKRWNNKDVSEQELSILFTYCTKVYPQRFFDILYQNEEIFEEANEADVRFFPNVDFKVLFNTEGISENTKKAMWKYLQLLLFTIIGEVKDKNDFGDSMNLFDGIDEGELQEKLKDTMSGITDFFKKIEENDDTENDDTETPKTEFENVFKNSENMDDLKEKMKEKLKGMPSIQNLQEHLSSLFDGKIGRLAKEMAEEIADDFKDLLGDENGEGLHNTQDVLKKLMKDPKKISGLMKTVGSKLDSKMKSGEISKDELVKEAGDLLGKMKEMGGGKEFNNMFKNIAKNMGGLGKNARVDTNAFKRMSQRNEKIEKMKERSEKRSQDKIKELEKIKLEQEKQLKIQQDFIQKYKEQHGDNNLENDFIEAQLIKELEGDEPIQKSTNKKKKKKAKK